jgi:subtilisin family serine protease
LDDDGNGKIDDIHGWHYYHAWDGSTFYPAEDANILDDYGHGTHVAGIAAAATNNSAGIAGVAGGATLLPIKVLDEYGNGWYSDIAAAMVYAADNGAHIINLSLGGVPSSTILCAAAEYAYNKGVVLVAAAGNSNSAVFFPAACEHVLAVTATDSNDQRAPFSNYGPQVDLAAPGVDIYSTWPWVSGYFVKSGTSMAASHVSGAAALIRSLRPDLSSSQVISRLLETSDDVSSLGPDMFTGWGRINAYRAIADLEPLPDLWASLTGPQLIRIGEPFSYTLTYGNRGVRNADSVTLTLELASGLVSSQPPQQEIGTVLANTGPYTQAWQARLQCSTVCLGAVYTTTVTIQSATPERTSIDDTFTWIARAAWPVFLPVVLK